MKKLNSEIRELQNKLNKDVDDCKLHDKNMLELSNKIHKLVNYYHSVSMQKRKFPLGSNMKSFYDETYNELKKIAIMNNKFPDIEEWDKYAKENNLLSSESIKYISMLEWKYLRLKVNKEINKNM